MSVSQVSASVITNTMQNIKSVQNAPDISASTMTNSANLSSTSSGNLTSNSSNMSDHREDSPESFSGKALASAMQKMQSDPNYKPTLQEEKTLENIKKINEELVGANREVQLSIHDDTNRVMAKIVNKETQEVIREIPSEKVLDMFYNMMEQSGLLIDEKK